MQSILVIFALCLPQYFIDYFTVSSVSALEYNAVSYDSIVSWSEESSPSGSTWKAVNGDPINKKSYTEKISNIAKSVMDQSISIMYVSAIYFENALISQDTIKIQCDFGGPDTSITVNGNLHEQCLHYGALDQDTLHDVADHISAVKIVLASCVDSGFVRDSGHVYFDPGFGPAHLSVSAGSSIGGGTGYMVVSYATRSATLARFNDQEITFSPSNTHTAFRPAASIAFPPVMKSLAMFNLKGQFMRHANPGYHIILMPAGVHILKTGNRCSMAATFAR